MLLVAIVGQSTVVAATCWSCCGVIQQCIRSGNWKQLKLKFTRRRWRFLAATTADDDNGRHGAENDDTNASGHGSEHGQIQSEDLEMLIAVRAERRGGFVRVIAAVIDAVAEQIGGNAEIFLGAAEIPANKFR